MRLSDLLTTVTEAAESKMKESEFVSAEERKATAEKVGIAAVKFGDLINHRTKDYIFDMDRFAAFEGNTGPYILYTIVRIKSILARYGAWEHLPIQTPVSRSQKDLMLTITRLAPALESAYRTSAPNLICAYIYELAGAVNAFYHDTRILSETDKNLQAGYISLIALAKGILELCTNLLGFQAPEKM